MKKQRLKKKVPWGWGQVQGGGPQVHSWCLNKQKKQIWGQETPPPCNTHKDAHVCPEVFGWRHWIPASGVVVSCFASASHCLHPATAHFPTPRGSIANRKCQGCVCEPPALILPSTSHPLIRRYNGTTSESGALLSPLQVVNVCIRTYSPTGLAGLSPQKVQAQLIAWAVQPSTGPSCHPYLCAGP